MFHGVAEPLEKCELRLSFVEAEKGLKEAPTLAHAQFRLLGECRVGMHKLQGAIAIIILLYAAIIISE